MRHMITVLPVVMTICSYYHGNKSVQAVRDEIHTVDQENFGVKRFHKVDTSTKLNVQMLMYEMYA